MQNQWLLRTGVAGIFVQVGGVILALLNYKNYNYNWNLSSLGARATDYSIVTGQKIPKAAHPEIFNVTIIVSSLLMLSIPIITYLTYKRKDLGEWFNFLLLFQVGFSFTAFIALFILGIYDVGSTYPPHYIATLIFFAFMIIAILCNWLVNIIYRKNIYNNWYQNRMRYYALILLQFGYLVFSLLGIFSLYGWFTEYYFINNGIFQKVWGLLYLLIWFLHLIIIQNTTQ